MNVHVGPYEESLIEAAKARRKMFMPAPLPRVKSVSKKISFIPFPVPGRYSRLRGMPISFKGNVGEFSRPHGSLFKPLTTHYRIMLVLTSVARKHCLRVIDIKSRRQDRVIVRARQEAMWRVRTRIGLSLPHIGRIFDRDHSTVLHAIRKHEARLRGEL